MNRHAFTLLLASLMPIVFALSTAEPASGEELSIVFEETRTGILNQIGDFAIDSCDPPCTGMICCDNHVCVHSVLACGAFPVLIDSFRFHASPRVQMAGFATQGVLGAQFGLEAELWFGQLDGEAWHMRGVGPGLYELVLLPGATFESAVVAVIDREGNEVARAGGHFWVFYGALSNATEPDWTLTDDTLQFRACNRGRCVQLDVELMPAG